MSSSTVFSRRVLEVCFILLIALGVFSCLAILSYNQFDSAWSQTINQAQAKNLAGVAGAWLADISLFYLGIAAIFLPLSFFYLAYWCLQTRNNEAQKAKIKFSNLIAMKLVGIWFVICSSCLVAHLVFNRINALPNKAGGVVGEVIGNTVVSFFNPLGSLLIALSSLFAATTMILGLGWIKKIILLIYKSSVFFARKVAVLVAIAIKKLWLFIIKQKNNELVIKQTELQARQDSNEFKKDLRLNKAARKIDKFNKLPTTKTKKIIAAKRKKLQRKVTPPNESLPSTALLQEVIESDRPTQFSKEFLTHLSQEVETKLLDFGVSAEVTAVFPGPVITRFEMKLAAGVKVSKISGLSKDLARALSVTRVRVVEVIPGKPVVGLEIPNANREVVRFKEVVESEAYLDSNSGITLALGKDISGTPIVANLAKMPHLLVAGTTGSGKSVGVNAMLLSMLYKATPDELKLILIDPKMLELSVYDGIPHLLTPVVTDMKDAAQALRWCVAEMERRYQLMAAVGVRNISGFNKKISQDPNMSDPLWQPVEGEEAPMLEKLPYIVVIVDEFADMIMVVGKKVEELIARIAQKARAAGIHLILATQRPSVDVITGLIKANVPTRIAFQVSSKIDSRTILDQPGAEQLLGYGDMLYLAPGTGIPMRVHGAFVSDEEVHRVVKDLKEKYSDSVEDVIFGESLAIPNFEESEEELDELYDKAVFIVTESRKASISYLQRKLKIGYNRSARLIETMEEQGIVSASLQNGNREVLAPPPVGSER